MDIEHVIELSNAQFGVVSRRQLLAGGVSRQRVSRWLDRRLLEWHLPGVYVVGRRSVGFATRAMSTQLWANGQGFLSSFTAGRIAGLRRMPSTDIHYTVPRSFHRAAPRGVHLDRSMWFDSCRDRVVRDDGLVVAEPHRMIWGLAADLHPRAFARAVEDAWHRRLIDPNSLSSYLETHRCRGKDGVAAIEAWLRRAATMRAPAESGLEQDLIEALERTGLPRFERQHPLRLRSGETIRLDVAWPTIRFAVEPGSSWFHGGEDGEHRDQLRDLGAAEVGWQILRLNERFRGDLRSAAHLIAAAHGQRTIDLLPPAC